MKKQSLGFTLIEVLIVISIIGILSSLTLLGLGTFRASGRDVRRVTDLRQISNALELYYAKIGAYPSTASGLNDLKVQGIIDSVPADPVNSGSNIYSYANCGTSGYILKAVLEETNKKVLDESYIGTCDTVSCAAATNEYCIKF